MVNSTASKNGYQPFEDIVSFFEEMGLRLSSKNCKDTQVNECKLTIRKKRTFKSNTRNNIKLL